MTTISSTVVRLPTAAKRKIHQRSVKAVREYKTANPWPGHHEFGPMRARRLEAERLASIMLGIEQTPAMLIVHAMLATMTDEQRSAIIHQLAGGAVAERKAHTEALTLVRTAKMTFAEQWDLLKAIDRLRGEKQ